MGKGPSTSRDPLVIMERPAPSSQAVDYAANRRETAAQSHMRKGAGHEEVTVCRAGCPRRDDRGGGGGAGRRSEVAWAPFRTGSRRSGGWCGSSGRPDSSEPATRPGPTGYVLYWQLSELGVKCDVVAPTLVPVKAGDRVKTDRRDAEKLARCYRAGDLTAVWVPDAAHEALRDLVRARGAAKKDQLRARHRLAKFLLAAWASAPGRGESVDAEALAWVKATSTSSSRRSKRRCSTTSTRWSTRRRGSSGSRRPSTRRWRRRRIR